MKHTNLAWDTETVDGEVVVLAFDNGEYMEYPTIDLFLEKITKGGNRSARFFSYNVRFDAEVMAKKLPLTSILELLNEEGKGTYYENFYINKLGADSLFIKNVSTNTSTKLWDIANFFNYLPLAKASKLYLPEEEAKLDSQVIEDFKDEKNTIDFYEANKKEIIRYCIQDSRATKLLADVFEDKCEQEGYDFSQPYSIGNMGIKWFKPFLTYTYKNREYQIPRIHPCHYKFENKVLRGYEEIQRLISRGGWNDCFMRGKFEEVWDADIVSAYPFIMRDAPFWAGTWVETKNEEELEDYTYGHVYCKIRNLDIPMMPSVYLYLNVSEILGKDIKWVNNSVIWSTIDSKWQEVLLPLPMYKFIRNYADVKFMAATYLKPYEEYVDFKPLRKPIDELYRRKHDSEKGTVEYNLAKIMMNGTSGKFIQKFHTDKTWFYYPQLYGYVTWRTKEIVLKCIIENDLWDQVVSVSTDGVVFTTKPKKLHVEKILGGWDLERFTSFVMVGNGIYYGDKENGDSMVRLRGFKMGKGAKKLRENIETHPDKRVVKMKTHRPLHLRECIKHHKKLSISDVGRFVDVKKRLNINKEIKRDWCGGKFEDIKDMLSGRILKSKPWEFREAEKLSKEAATRIKKEMEEDEQKG